jgi:hypothetical protein
LGGEIFSEEAGHDRTRLHAFVPGLRTPSASTETDDKTIALHYECLRSKRAHLHPRDFIFEIFGLPEKRTEGRAESRANAEEPDLAEEDAVGDAVIASNVLI